MTPAEFIDSIIVSRNLKNDAAFCRVIDITPPEVSRLRKGKQQFGAIHLIRLHAYTGIPVRELCAMLQDHLPTTITTLRFAP